MGGQLIPARNLGTGARLFRRLQKWRRMRPELLQQCGFLGFRGLKMAQLDVAEAADFAENSPEPAPAELYTDVLVGTY